MYRITIKSVETTQTLPTEYTKLDEAMHVGKQLCEHDSIMVVLITEYGKPVHAYGN